MESGRSNLQEETATEIRINLGVRKLFLNHWLSLNYSGG